MNRLALLALLAGCAFGHVRTDSGLEVTGYALGNSYLEACTIPPPADVGPMPKDCATVRASTATNLGEVLGAAISGAVAYFVGPF